jgi:hypothetical protein
MMFLAAMSCLISGVICILHWLGVVEVKFKKVFWRDAAFLRQTGVRALITAGLTGISVFCSSLALAIQTTATISKLSVLSAGLSGFAVFCTSLLEYYKK